MNLSKSAVAAALITLALLAGCSRNNSKGGGGSTPTTPFIGDYVISVSGGSGAAFATRSGGHAGNIAIQVSSGHALLNDGRTLPIPANNFITPAMQSGGVVTYAELVAAQAPVVAGDVATFTLTGAGFHVLPGITLDLSDAPYTGGSPATDVLSVVIESDEAICVDGRIIGTRAGNETVSVGLSSTHADGLVFTGDIDVRGAAGFDGGSVSLSATNDVVAIGRIHADGGAATATEDAGNGGSVTLGTPTGDLLLRGGSFRGNGGHGGVHGGDGGFMQMQVFFAGSLRFHWSGSFRGGNAGTGDAGDGGFFQVTTGGAFIDFYSAVDVTGGSAEAGNAGDGGYAGFGGAESTGWLIVYAEGGTATTGDGGEGGGLELLALNYDAFLLQLYADGGRGDNGGDGGDIQAAAIGTFANSDFRVHASGGQGVTTGGGGGGGGLLAYSAGVTIFNTRLTGMAHGGSASGAAGMGGHGGLFGISNSFLPGATLSSNQLVMEIHARGGNGATAGNGGAVLAEGTGLLHGTILADLAGGNGMQTGSAGGHGGDIEIFTEGGSVDMILDVGANGGEGLGAQGGEGGSFTAQAAEPAMDAGGPVRLRGRFTAQGGPSNTAGGVGGGLSVFAGTTGPAVFQTMNINLRGGSGNLDGGLGGVLFVLAYECLDFVSGTLNVSGGASSAGDGGDAGVMVFEGAYGQFNFAGQLRATGGNGATGGGDGATIIVDANADSAGDAAYVRFASLIDLRGGNATAGIGGNGGEIQTDANAGGQSGAIIMDGTIRVEGGLGTTGGHGGLIEFTTAGGIVINGSMLLDGAGNGNGGDAFIGEVGVEPVAVVFGAGAVIRANGAGTGVAGTINVDAVGTGGANIVVHPAAVLQTLDGNLTDQSATNIILD